MHVEIWHNPACSNSRKALVLIRDAGIAPTVVEYLEAPPSKVRLAEVIAAAGLTVREAIREKEQAHADLGLADVTLSDDALLDAMVAMPVLINRPFVISTLGTRLARPPEVVLEILPAGDT